MAAAYMVYVYAMLQAGGATLGLLSYAGFRHQCVISPAAVQHSALRLLRADPAIQEVLRLPLTAETPLLSIADGGRLRFKVLSREIMLLRCL